jgi:type IV pilus assembly protein PilV
MLRYLDNKGLSLIEVLAAMVILSVGMLGTASLVGGIIRGNQVSKNVTIATTLAQDKMEGVLKSGYTGISSTDAEVTEDYGSIAGYSNHMRTTTISMGIPASRMKTVTVQAYWRTGTNPVLLSMIITK